MKVMQSKFNLRIYTFKIPTSLSLKYNVTFTLYLLAYKAVYDLCDNQTSEKGSPCGKISTADVTYEIVKLAEALKLFGRNLLRLS